MQAQSMAMVALGGVDIDELVDEPCAILVLLKEALCLLNQECAW